MPSFPQNVPGSTDQPCLRWKDVSRGMNTRVILKDTWHKCLMSQSLFRGRVDACGGEENTWLEMQCLAGIPRVGIE